MCIYYYYIISCPRCRVTNETTVTPVCVTVSDKLVDEVCEDVTPDDKCYQQARSEFRQVHRVVADLLDDEMVTFEIESTAHTMVTAAVEVGFRVGLASRSWS